MCKYDKETSQEASYKLGWVVWCTEKTFSKLPGYIMKAVITIYLIHLHSSVNDYVQSNSNNHSLFTLKIKKKTLIFYTFSYIFPFFLYVANRMGCSERIVHHVNAGYCTFFQSDHLLALGFQNFYKTVKLSCIALSFSGCN